VENLNCDIHLIILFLGILKQHGDVVVCFIEDELSKTDVPNLNREILQIHELILIEYFGTLKYTTPAASAVSTHLPYIRSRFISTVLNPVQCALPSAGNIPFGWKGISLTIYCFPSVQVGSTGRTNQFDTGVKQCPQISSPINALYKVVSHQNESLP
jgi:hypothetical protein